MSLADPRLPLIVGGLAVLGLAGYLTYRSPAPGDLSMPHARIADLSTWPECSRCHAEAGLTAGCLSCHVEIDAQVRDGRGFHGAMGRDGPPACAPCHAEHHGASFPLVSTISWGDTPPGRFDHGHVAFALEGRHEDLDCNACHVEKRAAPFVLEAFPAHPRRRTFLGLSQECRACHEDVHAGGLSGPCDSCHGQESFRPAPHFDHADHFPLLGPHESAPCAGCHVIPDGMEAPGRLPFAEVRGSTCAACHDSPHRTPFGKECAGCHPPGASRWAEGAGGITGEVHLLTGFPLRPPHDTVRCEGCHDPSLPYDGRFRDPALPGYARSPESCGGCHGDPHGGQFEARYDGCLDCHERHRFVPSRFDRERHGGVFDLVGAHGEAACAGCHPGQGASSVRRFAGTPEACRDCHEDPHGGQFAESHEGCASCHDPSGFIPPRFGRERHDPLFPLAGGHAAVPCIACHESGAGGTPRRFAGTPEACRACHEDPHGGQFARELETDGCAACHDAGLRSFAISPFAHEPRTGFPLEGAHARAGCGDCHREAGGDGVPGAPADGYRLYRGTSSRCGSCHRDEHRGQFRVEGRTSCDRCHASTAAWGSLRFDHDTDARFPLDGRHEDIPCGRCHPEVATAEGDRFIQFRPLGAQCEDCHELLPQ